MKTKIGYKVVKVEGDKLVSTWAEGVFKKEYKVGECAHEAHEKLPLCLYDSIESADSEFRFDVSKIYKVFKCEYVPSRKRKLKFCAISHPDVTIRQAVTSQRDALRILVNDTPSILLAKSIKLLEEVTI